MNVPPEIRSRFRGNGCSNEVAGLAGTGAISVGVAGTTTASTGHLTGADPGLRAALALEVQVINGKQPGLDLIGLNPEKAATAADIQPVKVAGNIHYFRYGNVPQPEVDTGIHIGMNHHVVAGPLHQRFEKACRRHAPGTDVKTLVQIAASGQRWQQRSTHVRRQWRRRLARGGRCRFWLCRLFEASINGIGSIG